MQPVLILEDDVVLWEILTEVCPVPLESFRRRFRIITNASPDLWVALKDSTVVVIGDASRRVLWLPQETPLVWKRTQGVKWCFYPRPSPDDSEFNRKMLGYRIEELYFSESYGML